MKPHDLGRFTSVANPQVQPDGERVLFETVRMDLEADRYVRSIWIWDGEARRFTSGAGDASPRWSPDGERVAFLRKGPDKGQPAQLAVMASGGGEAEVVTSFELGVSEFQWAPDGDRLLVLARVWTEEWADLDDEERARRPRTITGARYRFDARGWIHDRRDHVYVVSLDDPSEPQRLGTGEADETGPAWSPDGTRIALLTTVDDPRQMRRGLDAVVIDVATGDRTLVAASTGYWRMLFDPDGTLHAVGDTSPDYPVLTSLWRVDGDPVDLTGHTDRSVFSFLMPPAMAEPHWLDDGFLIGRVDGGAVSLQQFSGLDAKPVLDGDRYVLGFSRSTSGDIYFCASTATDPGELFVRRADGSEEQLTSLNQAFRADVDLNLPTHFRVESEPGVEVDAWVHVPEGDGPFPVLLNIHGGPASQYGHNFFDEFQVYVGAGCAVVACNPRGSAGRGKEWLEAVKGEGWGVVDVKDVNAVIDHALGSDDRLDGSRLGIMGGSYGGFLTAWMIASDERFSSAVVERALLSWESFSGTSDIARDFSANYLGLVAPQDHEGLRAKSPMGRATEIDTPTLILHSESDHRCPIEQAEQLFMALLRNGVDVTMVRFPDEGHELSRSGSPRHRLERFDHILDWHAAHLTG